MGEPVWFTDGKVSVAAEGPGPQGMKGTPWFSALSAVQVQPTYKLGKRSIPK